jgi:hypothetical protein
LPGTIEVRKSSQLPVWSGAAPADVSRVALAPGLVTRPSVMPTTTDGDGEPDECLAREPGRVRHLPEVGDGDDDRGEHERDDDDLEQLDEDAADGLERLGEPGLVELSGHEPEDDAECETDEDLGPEGQADPATRR